MKTRKIVAYILTVAALLGLLAGCGKQDNQPSIPANNNSANQNTEQTQTTESNQATQSNQTTEATQGIDATTSTNPTATDATENSCIHILGGQWTVMAAATCTNEGTRYKTCVLCGDKVAEAIPLLDHTPGNWKQVKGKEATCSQEGYTGDVYCTACGEKVEEGSVIADPKFVDPANDDFTLAPDSPALKIGFVPFDVSKCGPRVK